MAQFQLSVSKTFTINTDDWSQPDHDSFAVTLAEVGWQESKGQPSTQQCEDAIRKLLESDDDFWEAYVALDEIEPRDVRVVCISRQFDRLPPKELPNAKATQSGTDPVAKPLSKPPESPKVPIPPKPVVGAPIIPPKPKPPFEATHNLPPKK